MKLALQVGVAMTSTQTLKKRVAKLSGEDDFRVVNIIARAPTKAERKIEIDEQLAEMGLTRDHHPGVFLFITEIQSREEVFGADDS